MVILVFEDYFCNINLEMCYFGDLAYVNSREELFTSLQSRFKDVIDDIAAGYERVGTEHGEGNVGRQRVEAEEIVQEQSNRDGDVL